MWCFDGRYAEPPRSSRGALSFERSAFHALYLYERLRGGCGNVQAVHLRSQTDEFRRLCRTRLALELAKNATVRRRILWMIGREVARVVQVQTVAHIRVQVGSLDLATETVRIREK